MVLDPEVGSNLEYEYSVIHEAAKAAWYITCVRRSLGGASGRSLDRKLRWVVVWVCGRMSSWCKNETLWSRGSVIEFFSGCE